MNDRFYKIAVVGLILTLMGVVMGIASPGLSDTDLGVVDTGLHLPVIVTTGALYLIVLSRLVTHPAKILSGIGSMKLFFPILLFCLASAAWSTDPRTTVRRASFLLLTTLVGMILGIEFEIPQFGRLYAAATLVHIAACAVLFVLARHLLYSPSDPTALKGLTTHKNIFGMEMGLGFLTFLFVPFQRLGNLRWLFVFVSGVLLLLSHSSGSLVSTVVALAFVPLLLIARFRAPQKVPLTLLALILLVGAGFLAVENAALLPAVLSKDATLTGRTELWSLILVAIEQRPLLGYGFDAFWQGLSGDSLAIIRGVGWLVPTAHNGYLDLLLGMGAGGALLFALPLLQTVWRSLRYVGAEPSSARYYPMAFLIYWVVYNFNESALLSRLGITYLVFAAVSTRLALEFAARRAPEYNTRLAYAAPQQYLAELPPV